MPTNSYYPFAHGVEQGRSRSACPTCGTNPGNQHTLTTSGICDGIRTKVQFDDAKQEQIARLIRKSRRRDERAA